MKHQVAVSVSPPFLTRHMVRVALWAGGIALAVAAFVFVTHEVLVSHGALAIDGTIIRWIAEHRAPALDKRMIDLTALGSPTLVGVFTAVTLAILIALRDGRGAVHLTIASLGTWALTSATKHLVERRRPVEVSQLVTVSGFSYPSGHTLATAALYLTIAIIAGSEVRAKAPKAVLIASAAVLVLLVGISRVYLGVHYPSDVVSGVSLGAAWALMLAAAVATVWRRTKS